MIFMIIPLLIQGILAAPAPTPTSSELPGAWSTEVPDHGRIVNTVCEDEYGTNATKIEMLAPFEHKLDLFMDYCKKVPKEGDDPLLCKFHPTDKSLSTDWYTYESDSPILAPCETRETRELTITKHDGPSQKFWGWCQTTDYPCGKSKGKMTDIVLYRQPGS